MEIVTKDGVDYERHILPDGREQLIKIVYATAEQARGYFDAEEAAATDQGLDPVMAVLKAADIEHDLWQSGGFCMIVTVPMPDNTAVWITGGAETHDAPEGTALYTWGHICHRDDDGYDNCPACHGDDCEVVPYDQLPAAIRDLRR